MLTDTDLLIKQIAYKVGYSRVDIFIKNFQKRFGVSPSVFRKGNVRKTKINKILVPLLVSFISVDLILRQLQFFSSILGFS